MATRDDAVTAVIALTVARRMMRDRPSTIADTNAEMAIAMGILHGCCGPNGDFTSVYRARDAAAPAGRRRTNRGV
jgi:hypothetical protein